MHNYTKIKDLHSRIITSLPNLYASFQSSPKINRILITRSFPYNENRHDSYPQFPRSSLGTRGLQTYMIQCNQCSKQYIGETKRRLKDRFNEHRRPVDNPSNISKPTTVSEHFLTNDHSANDITLIPLELNKSNRDSVRKAREAYLIERGKTLEPLGINKKDEM